ncbi:STAS domain-containing protein [Paremcibacter congregatus]|uniref:Anti-sigma factor antagonist n=1 Tax=Paremcibacter congregatus TaxID=2043170 RepID=A0A2G4YP37_9PROT|nr:STAS domain-containing protein [Paremcibacter congregatus]PHZ84070.1 anti-anti-sigma factor [Paremcibacter congregatus]QDE25869.1 STAS domain-containing protein [Paremcibacter congregatus]
MEYQVDVKEDVFEAKLSEKITFSDLDGFREMVKRMVASHSENNIVDLSAVEFIDSAGLGMLLLARDEISKTSANLTLRSPQGQVKRMFSVARFDQMFEIDNS